MTDQSNLLPLKERPPFATIQIGTFKTVEELRQALLAGEYRISDDANDLLSRINPVSETAAFDLYRVTNAELGLPPRETRVAEAFAVLRQIGGEKLPAEAGPQYRLQRADQLPGECELIYMDPVLGSSGDMLIFGVESYEGSRWLRGCRGEVEVCDAMRTWIFTRPRKY